MQGIIHEEPSIWLFLLVTGAMGGWAGWMTARSFALTWRPLWQCVLALLVLAGAVRFFHYALFEGTLLSLHYYLVDAAVVLAVGLLGYRYTRTRQMTTQYSWLYERTGPFSWRAKAGGEAPGMPRKPA
jgi:hypothetical protein